MKKHGDNHVISIPLTNTGKLDGTEVVQVYIRDLSDAEGPLKSLRAFKRVPLRAGASATVDLTLTPESFAFFDPETNTVHSKQGKFEVLYGNSSLDKDLKKIDVIIK